MDTSITQASSDAELGPFIREAADTAGSFLQHLARAALCADQANYTAMRPVLLEMKRKYPHYAQRGEARDNRDAGGKTLAEVLK